MRLIPKVYPGLRRVLALPSKSVNNLMVYSCFTRQVLQKGFLWRDASLFPLHCWPTLLLPYPSPKVKQA